MVPVVWLSYMMLYKHGCTLSGCRLSTREVQTAVAREVDAVLKGSSWMEWAEGR